MKKIDWRLLQIKPHHIVIAETSYPDYEMSRKMLLKFDYDKLIILEGWHCSCYDFNETEWEAIEYTRDEIIKLANADYNKENDFWNKVRIQCS